MDYFKSHYDDFRWSLQSEAALGFREPQLGALHAIAAHFSQRRDPAIVTVPTGSGKTAVLASTPFILRASRVLVITPSRIVREQIAEDIGGLITLNRLRALRSESTLPKVHIVGGRLENIGDWQEMESADIIIGTPSSLSPAIEQVHPPPDGFIDLVLVDEAHHSAAHTWMGLLKSLKSARQVLFTATPYRQDAKEIVGNLVYTYELRDAYKEGVFGQLEYEPIIPALGEGLDLAIARAAAKTLRADQQSGMSHRLMVRTGTKARAHDLYELYNRETDLSLKVITGDLSLRYVKSTISKLEEGAVDGIICVDMLGEGFDLPELKVAALHTPHRSLAVTLQFIGRFARTTAPNLGRAVVIAGASEMAVEKVKLYEQGAVWEEMIPQLSGRRIALEQRNKQALATFSTNPIFHEGEIPDLSLYSIWPYHHVKIYSAHNKLDLSKEPSFPVGWNILHRYYSESLSTAVYVTRSRLTTKWASAEHLDTITHQLFVFYADIRSNLLFICSSERSDGMYEYLGQQLLGVSNPKGLSRTRLNKVLLDLGQLRFFNIGMRKASNANNAESYRILTGSNVDEVIDQADGRTYSRGHWFGSAREGDEAVTIGLSSASKVWSNRNSQIPELVGWCKKLASKITSDRVPRTGSGLDNLSAGEEVAEIPKGIVYADWDESVYSDPKRVTWRTSLGDSESMQLLDCDLRVAVAGITNDVIPMEVSAGDKVYRLTFSLRRDRWILADPSNAITLEIELSRESVAFEDFLTRFPPVLLTSDFSTLQGNEFWERAKTLSIFDLGRLEVIDWEGHNVDVYREFGAGSNGKVSIQDFLRSVLVGSDCSIVLFDHGSGEIADFVTLKIDGEMHVVQFWHCKSASQPVPGSNVEDAYEVCQQASKSAKWTDRRDLKEAVERRIKRGSTFVKGAEKELMEILSPDWRGRMVFDVVVVQPGFSKKRLKDNVTGSLASADRYLRDGGRCNPLRVWCSS